MGASSRLPPRSPSARGFFAIPRFAAATASGEQEAARRALAVARRAGTARAAAEEAGLMLVLYAGDPAALEALQLLTVVWPGRCLNTAHEPGVGAARPYAVTYPRLIADVKRLHPRLSDAIP